MSEIKPIPTRYKGYHFRSRLEARWAVFFDALGVEWQYEAEGFALPDGTKYLPDFWLPKVGAGCFVEIKPGPLAADEACKIKLLADAPRRYVMAFCGSPWPGEFSVWQFNRKPDPQPEVTALLQSIAGTDRDWVANAVEWRTYYVPWFAEKCAANSRYPKQYELYSGINQSERCLAYCRSHQYTFFGFDLGNPEVCSRCGESHTCPTRGQHWVAFSCASFRQSADCDCDAIVAGHELDTAFAAARSARFEHGESGPT